MFDFIRRKIAAGGQPESLLGGNSIIVGLPGDIVVVNLERCWWAFESDGGGREVVRSAAGHEVFGDDDHVKALRAVFLRFGQESPETRRLAQALETGGTVIVIFPAKAVLRGTAIDLFEDFIQRRFQKTSDAFDIVKLYTAPVRPGGEKFCRKFRGRKGSQVVLNLTGEGLKYLHYDPSEKDVVIDALESDWPVSATPEALSQLAESRIRGMDPNSFRRMREAIESGLLLVYLSERPKERMPIFGSSALLLDKAPGGSIDLSGGGVFRWWRTSAAIEQE
jgi:hypothetical protein